MMPPTCEHPAWPAFAESLMDRGYRRVGPREFEHGPYRLLIDDVDVEAIFHNATNRLIEDGLKRSNQQEAQLCNNEPPVDPGRPPHERTTQGIDNRDSRVTPKGSRRQDAEARPGTSDTGT